MICFDAQGWMLGMNVHAARASRLQQAGALEQAAWRTVNSDCVLTTQPRVLSGLADGGKCAILPAIRRGAAVRGASVVFFFSYQIEHSTDSDSLHCRGHVGRVAMHVCFRDQLYWV